MLDFLQLLTLGFIVWLAMTAPVIAAISRPRTPASRNGSRMDAATAERTSTHPETQHPTRHSHEPPERSEPMETLSDVAS
ncbi:MAG: hypothetical protein KDI75_07390 [Xanthomonadales bacterium]|nr:hypothetical protein [Xanthomonadales bacterium]